MALDVAKEFAAWVTKSQAAEAERLEKMKTLSDRFTELSQSYDDIAKDLERERFVARMTQEDTQNLRRQLEDLQKSIDRSSFVLVLIDADADGYIFKDDYYSGVDGGRQAATDLWTAVRGYLEKEQPQLSCLPIKLKAFANEDGLSQLLVKAKIIKSPASLREFAKGFSQAYDTSEFVPVGSGKDRADEKIKGIFELSINNPTCRHVILGACHDNGYVRSLEKYEKSAVAERVTLLHSFDTGREFAGLKFKSIRLESIFRTKSVGHHKSPPLAMRPTLSAKNVLPPDTSTWAALLSATEDTESVVVSQEIKDIPPGAVLLNAADQRVDAELSQPPPEALNSWTHKIRKANMRYCRMYHLHSRGCKGDCGYSHGPLSKGEKLAYRRELRLARCHVGLRCRDPECVYGHNCSCVKQNCSFYPEMHKVDVSRVQVLRVL